MTPDLSVLICTHNPKERALRRTLGALAQQTLARESWELLLIDNRSSPPVRGQYDLSWHPAGRHVLAETLGKTHAIAAGVREARGNVLVVVDDDNVLHADYLETANRIFHDYPFMGAVGGIIDGEYEVPPPDWAKPYLPFLAIDNPGDKTLYAFTPDGLLTCPGAGMVIRKRVVEHYLQVIANDPLRKGLDPVGDKLSRSGDTDMMLCAYDVGLAKGYFPALRLTHLIPPERLTETYLARLRDEGEYCGLLLALIRGILAPPSMRSMLAHWLRTILKLFLAGKWFWPRLRVEWAAMRGRHRAYRQYAAICAVKDRAGN